MASWEEQLDQFPKLNINAKEFVPKFATTTPQVPENTNSDYTEVETNNENDKSNNHCESKSTVLSPEVTCVSEKPNVAPVEEEPLQLLPSKEFVNLVFIGHVDAGKSTIGGHLLYLTGNVDQRDLDKNMRKAKEMNRESWFHSWSLDLNEDERAKGITVECGRAAFETEKKHFTLLDAPGHKSYITNMISGSSQADVAILVISARIGEFEAGFEKGGQTQEHAVLVKTSGVKRVIVLINKMDDPSVNWSEDRYKSIRDKLIPFLKKTGFNPKTDIYCMPCSGFKGSFLKELAPMDECPWYRGPTFLEYLNDMPPLERNISGPLRLTVLDKYKDMGTNIIGKIESGYIRKNHIYVLMPIDKQIEVVQITKDDIESDTAIAGDNVKLKVKNIEEEEIGSGFVLCSPSNLCKASNKFDAQILVGDIKSIICAGFSAIIHLHSLSKEVSIIKILGLLDKKNPKVCVEKFPRFIKAGDLVMVRFEVKEGSICLENFKDFPQLGRFILREQTQTIAQGKIMKVFSTNVVAQE